MSLEKKCEKGECIKEKRERGKQKRKWEVKV
jgi:hypothetical protein